MLAALLTAFTVTGLAAPPYPLPTFDEDAARAMAEIVIDDYYRPLDWALGQSAKADGRAIVERSEDLEPAFDYIFDNRSDRALKARDLLDILTESAQTKALEAAQRNASALGLSLEAYFETQDQGIGDSFEKDLGAARLALSGAPLAEVLPALLYFHGRLDAQAIRPLESRYWRSRAELAGFAREALERQRLGHLAQLLPRGDEGEWTPVVGTPR